MKTYYQERAPVYDRVYQYPERQIDLELLHTQIPAYFNGRRVVEIAAGTGYWTEYISRQADSIHATDINSSPLEQIQGRDLRCTVTTAIHDAYDLPALPRTFSSAFAGHWFSHIPIDQRQIWLANLHQILEPGSVVVLLDNLTTQTKRIPIVRTDDDGNTYQTRTTDAGNSYEVLKNFPSEEALMSLVADHQPSYQALDHFWRLSYTLN